MPRLFGGGSNESGATYVMRIVVEIDKHESNLHTPPGQLGTVTEQVTWKVGGMNKSKAALFNDLAQKMESHLEVLSRDMSAAIGGEN